MNEMRKRYVFAGLGVLVLAAALVIPAVAQPRWGGQGPGGMMGFGWAGPATSPVASIDAAAERVRTLLASSGYSDLVVVEVMEFSNHFYVLVKEKSTGLGAFELLVERNGIVHLEYGPAMMWNTKYGHMAGFGGYGMMGGGMMGGHGPGPQGFRGPSAPQNPAAPQISTDRARQIALQYLGQRFPGATADEGTAFYGYFTFDVERNGKPVGMLSVNAYTGQIWYHSWHGAFVQEREF